MLPLHTTVLLGAAKPHTASTGLHHLQLPDHAVSRGRSPCAIMRASPVAAAHPLQSSAARRSVLTILLTGLLRAAGAHYPITDIEAVKRAVRETLQAGNGGKLFLEG